MTLLQQLQSKREQFDALWRHLTNYETLVTCYVRWVETTMPGRCYDQFPLDALQWLDHLHHDHNDAVVQAVQKATLVRLMINSVQRAPVEALPACTADACEQWFSELLERIDEPVEEGDFFHKDLAIAAHNMWPTSAICHYEPRPLPKRFVVAAGFKQMMQGLKLLWQLGESRQHFYEFHVEDRRMVPHFLAEGWQQSFLEMAQRLKAEPERGGVFGQAWLWDPALGEISSNMRYLLETPLSHGAQTFYVAPVVNPRDHIALNNNKRLQAYELGQYTPAEYLLVWPREALLAWAEQVSK